jgi:membrane fusion protein (multidrug efflux system)
LVPPDNATGNFTKIARRFTVRIRFSPRDANAALACPGMSVETAVAVSTLDNAPPTERGDRVDCSFDPSKDMVERTLTKLPEHPGLGRARPQGPSGTEIPARPEH